MKIESKKFYDKKAYEYINYILENDKDVVCEEDLLVFHNGGMFFMVDFFNDEHKIKIYDNQNFNLKETEHFKYSRENKKDEISVHIDNISKQDCLREITINKDRFNNIINNIRNEFNENEESEEDEI